MNIPKKGDVLFGTMPRSDGSGHDPVGFNVTSDQVRMLRSGGGATDSAHVYGHWDGQHPNTAGWYPLASLMPLEAADKLRKPLTKAAPPIPRDALKQPSHEVESPFDVISSAPKPEAPKAKQKLAMPEWLGRPILHPDHSQQLEMNAAINEFGMKMPRQQAEDQAYKDYLYHPKTGQYAQAAHHHLLGVKAADAAGDKEAARKHYMMYNMHAKALGKDPDELARELGAGEGQDLPKVYKFKAHKGDAFALQPPPSMSHDLQPSGVYASSPKPELTKAQREKLHELYNLSVQALAKAEKELPKKKKSKKHAEHCHCNAYGFCHRYGGGRCNAVKP